MPESLDPNWGEAVGQVAALHPHHAAKTVICRARYDWQQLAAKRPYKTKKVTDVPL